MLTRGKVKSPVNQELFWMAEYADGTYLSEFHLETQKPVKLYEIDKSKLIRFGLAGVDIPLYFEVFGGFFKVAGRSIQLSYRGEKDYPLIGHPEMYNELIYYKTGVADLDLLNLKKEVVGWGKPEGETESFHFGYRKKIVVENIEFDFKVECVIPFQKPIFITFTLLADKEMNGELVIMRNGQEIEVIKAPIEKGVGGKVSWVVV